MKGFTSLTIVLVLAACGNDPAEMPGGPPDAPTQPDAGKPEPDAPAPFVLTIKTTRAPALVAFREETSATWQALPVDGKSSFEVRPTGPYRVAVVCESSRSVAAVQYARTPADGALLTHTCGSAPRPFFVRGEVEEPGMAWFEGGGFGTQPGPWKFELSARAGAGDFALALGDFSAPDRLVLQRDVAVTADVDLGVFEAGRGEPLVPVAFTPTNATADETLVQQSLLYTTDDPIFLYDGFASIESGWNTGVAPAGLLRAGDHQQVTLYADVPPTGDLNHSSYRSVALDFHAGDATRVTLPDALGPITFEGAADRVTAGLPALPAATEVSLWAYSFSDDFKHFWSQETRLSPAFVEAVHPTTVVHDLAELPGFLPAWHIDPALEVVRGLDAYQSTSTFGYTSAGASEDLVPATPALRAHRGRALSAPELASFGPRAVGANRALRRR
jgi:hypothetical protein